MTRRPDQSRSDASAAVRAGVAYCVIVFAIGFCLGIVRVLVVVPRLGELAAVTLEAPIMLAASWAVSLSCIRRFRIPAVPLPRLLMGVVAFALLIGLEAALSVLLFGWSMADWLAQYRTVPGMIGLAAQGAFGLVPLVQAYRRLE